MRVTTLFKRLLRLDGVRVVAVQVGEEEGRERVVVDLARPARRSASLSALRFSHTGRLRLLVAQPPAS